jgi:DNA primase
VIAQGGQVLVAFDADGAGEKMAWRVAEAVPGVRRMVPAVGKDWNDRLLAEQGVKPKEGQTDRQAFKALWKWHRVAAEIGRPEAYLKRIAAVARDVVDGKGLSEKAIGAMKQDFERLDKKFSVPKVNPGTVTLRDKTLAQPTVETGM